MNFLFDIPSLATQSVVSATDFESQIESHEESGSQQGTYTNIKYDEEQTHSFGGADNCVDYDECTGGVSD